MIFDVTQAYDVVNSLYEKAKQASRDRSTPEKKFNAPYYAQITLCLNDAANMLNEARDWAMYLVREDE